MIWYGVFNSYIVIDDQGYDGKHTNDIVYPTDKWIGVTQWSVVPKIVLMGLMDGLKT